MFTDTFLSGHSSVKCLINDTAAFFSEIKMPVIFFLPAVSGDANNGAGLV